jgi:catechol 2,3-dioxygenase-like lactoylglutathione lyase family enzyme
MPVQQLGHVVLKVRDLQRSEAFYAGVLGMQIISQSSEPAAMTFFTLGNHHDSR